MAALAVDRRREEDEEELFGLYRDVFGHEMTEASRRRWAWQYRDNPCSDGAPEIWVAREGGRILGQYASMPVCLWWGDREVRASWGMDVFLREEVRGQGVGVAVRPATGFGPEYDRLWARARPSYAMCVRRDAAYLEWKYERCPHRRYARWEARRGDDLVGSAVSRHEDYRGLRLGWITDVFTEASDGAARQALLSAVLADFRQARVARAQAFSLHAGLGNEMLRRGFSRGPSPMQFCVRSRAGGNEVLADPGRWHVVFGDSDMDR